MTRPQAGEGEVPCPRKQARIARARCVEYQDGSGCGETCPFGGAARKEEEEWRAERERERLVRDTFKVTHQIAYVRWGKGPKKPHPKAKTDEEKRLTKLRAELRAKKRKLRIWERP